jgi:hypothetical protein
MGDPQEVLVRGVADIAVAPDGRAVLLLLNGSVAEVGALALPVPAELQAAGAVSRAVDSAVGALAAG